MESCCIYIYVLWIPSRTVVQCYYFVFHPHESAWWAPLNRFYAGLAGIAETCIGSILRVLHSLLLQDFKRTHFQFIEIKVASALPPRSSLSSPFLQHFVSHRLIVPLGSLAS